MLWLHPSRLYFGDREQNHVIGGLHIQQWFSCELCESTVLRLLCIHAARALLPLCLHV